MLALADLKRLDEQADIGPWTVEGFSTVLATTDPTDDELYRGDHILAGDGESIVAQRVMRHNAAFILACVEYVRQQLGAA